jgi:L-amino acid N-acyltransferase YncA
MIREAYLSDADAIVAIYNHYIRNSVATFEEEEIDSVEMAERIGKVTRAGLPWIVEEAGGEIRGYAYAGPWNSRAAYKRTAEVTIYIAPSAVSSGVGTQLYTTLFSRLPECRIHCVIAGITLPNPPSIAIHEKFGMQKSGEFKEVGYKFGQWLDVGYWTVQLSA